MMHYKSEILIPPGICPEAKIFLKNIIKVLEDENIVTTLDHSAIEILGYTYDTYIKATKTLLKEGQTFLSPRKEIKSRPEVRIQSESLKQVRGIMDSFGLNPHARKEQAKPKEKSKEESDISKFIKKTKKVNVTVQNN